MGWTGWGADYPDPSNFFEPTLSSRALQDEGSQNVAFFSNEELDRVLDQAHRERDRDRRMALYQRAEEIVHEQAPWVPTTVSRTPELWQPYVRGYEVHPILTPQLSQVWLDAGARASASLARGRRSRLLGASPLRPWGRP